MDINEGKFCYSKRFVEWLGFSNDTKELDEAYDPVPEEYRQSVSAAIAAVIQPGSSGVYENEHPVINRVTGQVRIIHAQARIFYDAAGNPQVLRGTAQDVTEQRQLQLALEQQVQERTEELTATNEQLAASNERLVHSNEELAQYAYVASHDLQEPLRKIRMFSGMLESKQTLASDNRELVTKIGQSAERMSMLIRDLLDFSRLLKSEMLVRPVDLAEITASVVNDFELTIGEKKAIITTGKMPVVQAIGLQMNQLFYNLLGNALKFSKPGIPPVIEISAEAISPEAAAEHIQKPLAFAQYYHIAITDNGIGFEVKYSEQIFEVFKRLHSREIYPGSGIGLALCRRIVENHNGRLYASSTPGVGTTFHLILPDKQQDYESPLANQLKWA